MEEAKTAYHGIYRAEVVTVDDTDDPDSGRIQVRVWPMMQLLDVAVLPWATPAFGLFEGGESGKGVYTVPAVGSKVFVFFEAGSVLCPVYFASAPGASDGPSGADPNKKIWVSQSGHRIEIDDTDGSEKVSVTHKDGSMVEMDSDGNVSLVNVSGKNVKLGAGALQTLLLSTARTALEGHVHGAGLYLSPGGGAPVTGSSGTPEYPVATPLNLASDVTSDTKAS